MIFEELKIYDIKKVQILPKSDCIQRLIEMAWQDRRVSTYI